MKTKNHKPEQADYDSPWKEAMEKYFEEFMGFFFHGMYSDIDWSKGYTFLDKELEKIVRDSEIGRRIADKLVKVYLKNGNETWLLIHIEIQGKAEKNFAERMYIYNYRLFDRYRKEVISLAVLTDSDPEYKPGEYSIQRREYSLKFKFPVAKLLDYGKNWGALEKNRNPFSIVVMAHLKAQELGKGKEEERKIWKMNLCRMLYKRGYVRKDILELFRFIDWLLILPEDIENQFWEELKQTEQEGKKMPYITSVERIGIKKGIEQGIQKGIQKGIQQGIQSGIQGLYEAVIEILELRFKKVPASVKRKMKQITDISLLKQLNKAAVIAGSIQEFENIMDKETDV